MLQEILADGGAFGCEAGAWFESAAFLEEHAARSLDLEDVRQNKLFSRQVLDFEMRGTVGFLGNMDLLAEALKTRGKAAIRAF